MHIVLAQPGASEHVPPVRSIAPDARITCASPGSPIDPTATVLFADRCPPGLSHLRWVQLGSHGYAQLEGVIRPDTVATNASGVQDKPIAEWCIMMLLALSRDLPAMLTAQRTRRWDRSPVFQRELAGRRVGILGFGNIGREVARHCTAMGLEVWTMTRAGIHDRGPRYDPFNRGTAPPAVTRSFDMTARAEFYGTLDALIVTTPLTPQTRGLVDAEALAQLPTGALLLNPARAGVVEEQPLLDALRSGHLGGAALDDHYRQPMPPDDPFWDLPNTIVTAHISGSSQSPWYQQRIWDLFLTNLRRYVSGAPLLNVIAHTDLA
ncbi:D-2-hydroxyacid dehydrogenase [Dactylosporangium vinaceum]|uniref:D-2-hydroxyacid dehydrogenase n=1 Tax=Dactylosporangium vinaceum TaxID=53362 RepID=A0ABV5MHH9_9ACTN|nr:D-2-hydroxyacid dehydrogenase [Dactylosporangium vinaceum]UAB94775.1 D-2-hydroxyacid dehydrogenase [Dactylosporangium vinaceum]